jgi:P-type conjugative transfer protein TrbG
MDPRRFLIAGLAGVALGGCAGLKPPPKAAPLAAITTPPPETVTAIAPAAPANPPRVFVAMAPIPDPAPKRRRAAGRARSPAEDDPSAGRDAIAAANRDARTTSEARAFQGGLQVFRYAPGRIYEVWAAPLRVTTLTLAPGETVIAKAAGDTVRWQIGETVSGAGETQRAHVMIKPLVLGLETNLALTTNRRLYLLQLRSGPPAAFNAAVAWDVGAALDLADADADTAAEPAPPGPQDVAAVPRHMEARYAIRTKGRRPAWTPSAVMTDGVRTYLSFPQAAGVTETPALFAVDAAGQTQMVNYRQQAGLWVVDRVLDRAELRLGGRRPQVVRIERLGVAP